MDKNTEIQLENVAISVFMLGERDKLREQLAEIKSGMKFKSAAEDLLEVYLRIRYIEGMIDCYSILYKKLGKE